MADGQTEHPQIRADQAGFFAGYHFLPWSCTTCGITSPSLPTQLHHSDQDSHCCNFFSSHRRPVAVLSCSSPPPSHAGIPSEKCKGGFAAGTPTCNILFFGEGETREGGHNLRGCVLLPHADSRLQQLSSTLLIANVLHSAPPAWAMDYEGAVFSLGSYRCAA